MTVGELKRLLNNLPSRKEVLIQVVDEGITYAHRILLVEEMEEYDGKDVWLIPEGLDI